MTTVFHANGDDRAAPVSFSRKVATARFKDLYRDGMGLVEEVAAYLDGQGRREAKELPRQLAVAYAAESMRLTTRLMQIASWLLVQKAIVEGGLEPSGAKLEKNKVQLSSQGIASQAAVFSQLPEVLQDLTARSLQVQTRILRLEAQLHPDDAVPPMPPGLGIQGQIELLRRSFPGRSPTSRIAN